MKIVLDANIYISAFYWGGNPKIVTERAVEGLDELYYSKEILDEIADVMARTNFETEQETIDTYIQRIRKLGKKIIITGKVKNICRDIDDNDKLECGTESHSDYIITGDKDLLVLNQYNDVKIITAKDYLEIVRTKK